jgi:ubiquinone/menaquinone biosynthesis C-methylase UbiE
MIEGTYFKQALAEKLSFQGEYFDYVVSNAITSHRVYRGDSGIMFLYERL